MDYSFRGLGFPFSIKEGAFPAPTQDADLIAQSIMQIIGVTPTERVFDPNYGCNVMEMVFENNDSLLQEIAKINIQNAISRHEPRAILQDITFSKNADGNALYVNIIFTVKYTGETGTVSQKLGA
jgi:phage baseplate assembly protein W